MFFFHCIFILAFIFQPPQEELRNYPGSNLYCPPHAQPGFTQPSGFVPSFGGENRPPRPLGEQNLGPGGPSAVRPRVNRPGPIAPPPGFEAPTAAPVRPVGRGSAMLRAAQSTLPGASGVAYGRSNAALGSEVNGNPSVAQRPVVTASGVPSLFARQARPPVVDEIENYAAPFGGDYVPLQRPSAANGGWGQQSYSSSDGASGPYNDLDRPSQPADYFAGQFSNEAHFDGNPTTSRPMQRSSSQETLVSIYSDESSSDDEEMEEGEEPVNPRFRIKLKPIYKLSIPYQIRIDESSRRKIALCLRRFPKGIEVKRFQEVSLVFSPTYGCRCHFLLMFLSS